MNKKRYFPRFIKCCIYLTVWVMIILVVLMAIGQTQMSFADLFTTSNGLWLWVFVVVFSLVNPLYGYCRRRMDVNAASILDAIDDIAKRGGYERTASADSFVKYRAVSPFKKLMLQYEDEITIEFAEGGETYIEGPRKEVVKVLFRIDTYLISKEKND